MCAASGEPERLYGEWLHTTLGSWNRKRRVIGKAQITHLGENPRFAVTSLRPEVVEAQKVYEVIYCQRGDMENRIKEQQLDLFADRTSARQMRANQIRLWFSSVAYVLLNDLRRLGLRDTPLAGMRPVSLRLKLLKIGARIRVTVRKVWVHLATGYPHERLFAQVYSQLQRAGPPIV